MSTYHYDEAQDDEGHDATEEDEVGENAAVVPRQVVVIAAAAAVSLVVIVDAVVVSQVVGETRSRNHQHFYFLFCDSVVVHLRHLSIRSGVDLRAVELTSTLG